MTSHRILPAAAAVAGAALLAAGCGGAPSSPAVASLGSGATTTTASSPGSAPSAQGRSTGPGGGGGFSMVLQTHNGLAFARCMRAHGVANFPDPNSKGQIEIGSANGIDPRSPKFQQAQRACQKLLGGKPPGPAQQAKLRQSALAFSACMRHHGLPDFPDPDFSNGGIGIKIRAGGDLDPQSQTFQAAQRACQGLMKGPGAKG
jgi:hypothetical protein